MLLLTLLLNLLLYCQQSSKILTILLTLIFLLMNILGPCSKVMTHEENSTMDHADIFATLGLRSYITPPNSWMYNCLFFLYQLGSKYPPTEYIYFGGCVHSASFLPLHLWLLCNFLKLLLRFHFERHIWLPLNHHISNLCLYPQDCACILYLKCI